MRYVCYYFASSRWWTTNVLSTVKLVYGGKVGHRHGWVGLAAWSVTLGVTPSRYSKLLLKPPYFYPCGYGAFRPGTKFRGRDDLASFLSNCLGCGDRRYPVQGGSVRKNPTGGSALVYTCPAYICFLWSTPASLHSPPHPKEIILPQGGVVRGISWDVLFGDCTPPHALPRMGVIRTRFPSRLAAPVFPLV